MKLHEQIAELEGEEKHIAKINAIASLGAGKYGDYDVEEISVERDLLKIKVKGIDNTYWFKNPPILVSDENGDVLRKDKEGKVVRRLREDPKQAITESLTHAISISNNG